MARSREQQKAIFASLGKRKAGRKRKSRRPLGIPGESAFLRDRRHANRVFTSDELDRLAAKNSSYRRNLTTGAAIGAAVGLAVMPIVSPGTAGRLLKLARNIRDPSTIRFARRAILLPGDELVAPISAGMGAITGGILALSSTIKGRDLVENSLEIEPRLTIDRFGRRVFQAKKKKNRFVTARRKR